MKKISIGVIIGLFLIQGTICAQSEKRELRKQKEYNEFVAMQAFIDSGNYTFNAERANPSGAGSIDLTTHNAYLVVAGDSAQAHLPFFGRAYNAGYSSNSGGVKFSGPMLDYKNEINEKKKSITISFRVSNEGNTYDCTLSVFRSGSSSLIVLSTHRSSISYSGNIILMKE